MPGDSTPDSDQKRNIGDQETVRSPGTRNLQVTSCGNPSDPGQSKQSTEWSEKQGRRRRRAHYKLNR